MFVFLLEPAIAEMAALHAEETDIRKISTLCDEVEALLLRGEDHTGKDIEFHTAIAMSSKKSGRSAADSRNQQLDPAFYPTDKQSAFT